MKTNPVIALLTDFGVEDGYVASMKAVILSRAPNCRIIDVSHSVQPQNIDQAAFLLWSSYKYFPTNTIFICVVDPGVGTDRKIICAEGEGYKFLAPDNGILKFILGSIKKMKIYSVNNSKYFLTDVSSTFHGRDIFAPAAAHIINGLELKKLGPQTTPLFHAEHFVEILPIPHERYHGKIINIDRYGNIITNFLFKDKPSGTLHLKVAHKTINEFEDNYAKANSKNPFMIIGSAKLLEVAVKNGSASSILHPNINQEIILDID
jgi:S-adenosylmethionine hydrolase